MGWGSAGQIFDPVARALIDSGATDKVLGSTCYVLAKQLTDGDWDTVDESIDAFRDHPIVVDALRRADGWHEVSDEGTAVIDYDERADEWSMVIDAAEVGRRPGTPEGHDELVRLWFANGDDTPDRREQMNRSLINPSAEEASA